jgi:predicted TIM-barrel fold metal-dependent hydrolase
MLGNGARRVDAFPADGTFAGSDYNLLRAQLLDRYPYYRGILTHDQGEYGQHPNLQFGIELCRATNDWNIERWLSLDERLYSVVAIPTAAPEAAAKEIRRVGNHPRLVSVLMAGNGFGKPYGDPVYDPIYEAASDMGLGIAIHLALNRPNSQTTAVGGPASTSMMAISQCSQEAMHYVSSLIVQGVFEKYPSLHVVLKEFGTAWLPSLLWSLDKHYDLLKFESRWVKKLPSEYFREHIKLSTQPLEESPDPKQLVDVLNGVDGIEDLLCFSSDYPHFTFDDPTYIARHLPEEWHAKVFCENACSVYGWEIPRSSGDVAALKAPVQPI